MRKRRGLSPEDLIEVRRLIDTCNEHEGLDLTFYLEDAGPDSPSGPHQFLHHERGNLVGLLTLQPGRKFEVSLAVHPSHRRRGIGRGLLAAAGEDAKRRGHGDWLLVCEEHSRSGRGFAQALGAEYRFSEYRMRLDHDAVPTSMPAQDPVRLRQAGAEDVVILAQLISTSFGRLQEEERTRVARDIQRSSHRFFIASAGGETVGSLGLAGHGRRIYVVALNVLPQFRGRGYGRQMLAAAVEILRGETWDEILLEVATDNRSALSLYRSCGFQELTSYRYYHMSVP